MGYAMNEYGHDLTTAERKEKALALAASWWGQWQWYELRRPVLYALHAGQQTLNESRDKYLGAKAMLNFFLDMPGEEIEAYCKAHVSWLLDDHALDIDAFPAVISPWIDGNPVSVTVEQM